MLLIESDTTSTERTDTILAPYAPHELKGRIPVKDLLDRLVDLPDKDARIKMSLQEGKSFPLDMESFHALSVEGLQPQSVIWRSSQSGRNSSQKLTPWQDRNRTAISAIDRYTVRDLIYKLTELDLKQIVDIGGHFYSEFVLIAFPPTPSKPPEDIYVAHLLEMTVQRIEASNKSKGFFARLTGR